MNIKDLAPDSEICQEAQKKGVEIESNFKWYKFSLSDIPTLQLDPDDNFATLSGELEWKCPAPLTDEILEKLPEKIIPELSGGKDCYLIIVKDKDFYTVGYDGGDCIFETVQDKKLSNALYLLYMELKKEGII